MNHSETFCTSVNVSSRIKSYQGFLFLNYLHRFQQTNTEFAVQGVNLSGGQRQRLALARALYRRADIYLLDDPLSAVDTHTGRHIMDFLMEFSRDATVIMPCHQLHFLHHADLVVTLQDSSICEKGTFDELMSAGGDFSRLMARHDGNRSPDGSSGGGQLGSEPTGSGQRIDPTLNGESDAATLLALRGSGKSGSLIALEEREIGKIGMDVYQFYGRQYTFMQLSPLVLFYLLAQLSQFAMDMWMSYSSPHIFMNPCNFVLLRQFQHSKLRLFLDGGPSEISQSSRTSSRQIRRCGIALAMPSLVLGRLCLLVCDTSGSSW